MSVFKKKMFTLNPSLGTSFVILFMVHPEYEIKIKNFSTLYNSFLSILFQVEINPKNLHAFGVNKVNSIFKQIFPSMPE